MTRRVLLVALIVSLVAIVAAPVSAAELTPEQQERFIAGAQHVHDWSAAEAEAFLLEHPEKVAGVGVTLETTGGDITTQASGTFTQQWEVRLYNLLGQKIWTWFFKRTWVTDGFTVTKAGGATLWSATTTLGKSFGWKYDGIIGQSAEWRNCDGHFHGCHNRFYQGQFSSVAIGTTEQPWQSATVWYDGSWRYGYGR